MSNVLERKGFLNFVLICFIASIFFFLRFYKLDQRINFDWDLERDAFAVKKIVSEKRPVLIGPRVVGEDGFFLAPYHTYTLAPFYYIAQLNPLIAIKSYIYFFNFVRFIFSFLILKKLFGLAKTVIFLSLLSVNSMLIDQQTTAWNPTLVVFGVLIYWYFLFTFYRNQNLKISGMLGLVFGIFLNFHFQFIFQIIFFVLIIFSLLKRRVISKKKFIFVNIFFICGFLVSLLPLFLFDLRHSFLNTKLFVDFLLNHSQGIHFFSFQSFNEIFRSIFIIKFSYYFILYFVFILVSFYLHLKNKGFFRVFYLACFSVLIFTPLIFSFYKRSISEYYFTYFLPIFFLIFAEFFSKLKKQVLFFFLVFFLSYFFVFRFQHIKLSEEALFYKMKLMEKVKKVAGRREIYLAIETPIGHNSGFFYLADYFGVKHSSSPNVPLFLINQPPKKNEIRFGYFSLKFPEM